MQHLPSPRIFSSFIHLNEQVKNIFSSAMIMMNNQSAAGYAQHPQPQHVVVQRSPQQQQQQQQMITGAPHFVQHIQASQLPQIPAYLLQNDVTCLMCTPMHFNTRDGSWTYQSGTIVPPNTATVIAGYHIMHQPMPQQQHQHMQNGYAHAPSFEREPSSTGSQTTPNNNNNNNGPSANPTATSGAVPPMYGYPHAGLPHYANSGMQPGPGQYYAPHGFHPSQIQMTNSLAYGQAGQHQLSGQHQTLAGHPDNSTHVDHAGNEGLGNGKLLLNGGGDSASETSAQSRSSTFSSTMDLENPIGQEIHAVDSGNSQDGTTFSRSTTPSPESVTTHLVSGNVETEENQQNAYDASEEDSTDNTFGANQNRVNSPTTGHAESLNGVSEHSHDALVVHSSPALQNQISGSANRSVSQSPSLAQAAVASPTFDKPITPADHVESPKSSLKAPVPTQPSAPKNWASIVGQGGPPKVISAPNAASVTRPTPPPVAAGRTSTPNSQQQQQQQQQQQRDRPNSEKSRHGHAGGRVWPKLSHVEADSYPDDLQVFMRDIPVTFTEEIVAAAMSEYGDLVDVRLRMHPGTSEWRYCFLLFAKREAADKLLKKGTHVTFNGKTMPICKKKRTYNAYNNSR
ncbi:hypothetical protein BV898_01354 [Hypsibius exemplaris]|uniref:RRM domain-containing protein n=1 Tax=Hypsibius exemplaris TaxID=2072580 RepID=A0A1W0XBR0_HYPEX|nr:hypothetical protein BV898_01354 [Hypsibius exemplaris]